MPRIKQMEIVVKAGHLKKKLKFYTRKDINSDFVCGSILLLKVRRYLAPFFLLPQRLRFILQALN